MENLSKLKNDDGLRLLEYFLSPYLLGTKFVIRSFKWLLDSKECIYCQVLKSCCQLVDQLGNKIWLDPTRKEEGANWW